ncbi:ADP-ribosylglycohydrolase family protein [Streptomyces chartreusis]|uniref:ADP-ribosylglycohydrolase family protein n=1 Tax=Streptomyces chartreusis TaxID=1969 RepID=UPI0036986644
MQWQAVRGSAHWAAYGDALGFITELTDTDGVRRRTGHEEVATTVPWKRRVGGRYGRDMPLPAGAYSDDTQLRLATSRAIRGDGEFDAEAFSKIELVAWQAYALGAGRGTKAAANGLMRVDAKWSQNIFATKAARYTDIGGNGAAMRIQPHVWSARDLTDWDTITRDVVRNAVSTHGHPRGILGAVLHALLLAQTLATGTVPGPDQWRLTIDWLGHVPDVIDKDEELAYLWLPSWTQASGTDLRTATAAVAEECHAATAEFDPSAPLDRDNYAGLVDHLGGFANETRGSGTITTLLAAMLAFGHAETPEAGLQLAANTLGSDTDTIATMAGALLGAFTTSPAPGPIQDDKYLDTEARRLWEISQGGTTTTFAYPDLLRWSPPRATLDLVGRTEAGPALAGLGLLRAGAPSIGPQATYVWGSLPFGQNVLVRAREDLKPLAPHLLPPERRHLRNRRAEDAMRDQTPLFETSETAGQQPPERGDRPPRHAASLEDTVRELRQHGFPPEEVGRALLNLINSDRYGAEKAAVFVGLLTQAHHHGGDRR